MISIIIFKNDEDSILSVDVSTANCKSGLAYDII